MTKILFTESERFSLHIAFAKQHPSFFGDNNNMLLNPMASNLMVSMEMGASHLTLGGTAFSSTAYTPYEVAHHASDVEAANIQRAYSSMTEPSANRIDAGVRFFSPSTVDHMASVMKARRYEIDTMITLDYRASAWGVRRIALDAVSNHLQADSGGTAFSVRLKQNGRWVDLHEADRSSPTEEVVIEDNGRGYDAELLSILYSTKSSDEPSVGQFGEGLKMIAAAALRCGVALEYRSHNWVARPFVKHLTMGGHPIQKLCFEVTEKNLTRQGSQTVFLRPPKKLMDEVFDLPNQLLALNRTYKELYRKEDAPIWSISHIFDFTGLSYEKILSRLKKENLTLTKEDTILGEETDIKPRAFLRGGSWLETGEHQKMAPPFPPPPLPSKKYPDRIIDLKPSEANAESNPAMNTLFIKGVAVEQKISALFSYDLRLENITPDRWLVDQTKVLDAIEGLLKDCTNPIVIDRVLDEAHRNPYGDCHEFRAFISDRHGMVSNGLFGSANNLFLSSRWRGLDMPMLDAKIECRETLWTATFKKMFGENAIIASHDTNVNSDAKAMGLNPIQLNHSIARYLDQLGVPTAGEINREKEYRFIEPSEWTDQEREFLGRIPEINRWLLQDQPAIDVENIDVKIYSGLFLKSGREIESSMGVQITDPYGKKSIGIKRAVLKNWEEFFETYIHELGHYVTGAGDYDRRFTDFFVRALRRRASMDLAHKPT